MNLPFKVNARERKFLMFGGLAVLLILAFNAVTWYDGYKQNINEISDAKRIMIEKQLNRIAQKEDIEKKAASIKQMVETQERGLLQGDKPPVAAAALQNHIKGMAGSLKIDIKLERALNPMDADNYLGIPVELGFTATTGDLKTLLINIRNSPYLLAISEMKIRVTNISKPDEIYITLVVMGFIKKTVEADNIKKEAENAA